MTVAVQTEHKRFSPVAAGLVLYLLLLAASAVAVWYAVDETSAVARGAALTFFVLAMPFLVLAHEAGHYAAAKLLGWRVPLFVFGGITMRLSPFRVTAGAPAFGDTAAGAVVAVPPEGRGSDAGWAFVFAGGPLVNLALGGLAWWAVYHAPDGSVAPDLFFAVAVISVVTGLYNLWPYLSGSDGSNIVGVLLVRNGDKRSLYARFDEQIINGVRPRDWPLRLIEAILRETLWSSDPEALLLRYAWHMDRGEIVAARAVLERAAPDERVLTERAFIAAFHDDDAVGARRFLAGTRSWRSHATTGYWRAAAALAVTERDAGTAREAIRKGRLLCASSPYATAFDRECFDELERRA